MGTEIVGRWGQSAGECEPGPDNPKDKTRIPLGVVANPQDSRFSATTSLLPVQSRDRTFTSALGGGVV